MVASRPTARVAVALGAVALLELLAGAAPAGIVPADVLVLALDDGARRDGGRDGAAACDRRGRDGRGAARGGDRVGAGERLVLVAEVAVRAAVLLLLERRRVGG